MRSFSLSNLEQTEDSDDSLALSPSLWLSFLIHRLFRFLNKIFPLHQNTITTVTFLLFFVPSVCVHVCSTFHQQQSVRKRHLGRVHSCPSATCVSSSSYRFRKRMDVSMLLSKGSLESCELPRTPVERVRPLTLP